MNHERTQRSTHIGEMKHSRRILCVVFGLLVAACSPSPEPEIRIAVASNFKAPAAEIVRKFGERTGSNATISLGSTGKLFAQISNGAPYDVFLAADSDGPAKIEKDVSAAAGSRFTYAIGKIVLWSADPDLVDSEGKVLGSDRFSKLAIANPALAPYGKAAEETLRKKGLWEQIQDRLVRGESIGQAFQFVSTRSADMGFVAYSQTVGNGGSRWVVPQELYSPIEQQAVLLKDRPDARAFLRYLESDEAKAIIRRYGYATK